MTGETDAGTPRPAAARGLVCVIRDPSRNPWPRRVIELATEHAAAGEPAVLVDVGWPAELAGSAADLPIIRTRGIAPGLLAAAAEILQP